MYTRAAPCWRRTCVPVKDLAAVGEQLKHLQLAAVGGDHDVAVVFAQELHVQHLVVVADKLREPGKINVPTWMSWNIPACLTVPTCCSVVRPASWYSIMLCSAVTVASLEEAGRRRRWVKLRGLSAFFSSSSPSSSSFTETVLRVWLKTQRAVLGSHTLSMPLTKGGKNISDGETHKHTTTHFRSEPLLPAVMKCNLGFFTPI